MVARANRLALPEKFLEFCGSFPIYNIEQTSSDSMKSSFKESLEEGRQGRIVVINVITKMKNVAPQCNILFQSLQLSAFSAGIAKITSSNSNGILVNINISLIYKWACSFFPSLFPFQLLFYLLWWVLPYWYSISQVFNFATFVKFKHAKFNTHIENSNHQTREERQKSSLRKNY